MRGLILVVLFGFVPPLLQTARATADRPRVRKRVISPGCEIFESKESKVGRTCFRCKTEYYRDSTGQCLRLGDFGSTKPKRPRRPPPKDQ